jgi:hypothetical protein
MQTGMLLSSGAQTCAALGTTGIDDLATTLGLHARTETVVALALDETRLKRSFHDVACLNPVWVHSVIARSCAVITRKARKDTAFGREDQYFQAKSATKQGVDNLFTARYTVLLPRGADRTPAALNITIIISYLVDYTTLIIRQHREREYLFVATMSGPAGR